MLLTFKSLPVSSGRDIPSLHFTLYLTSAWGMVISVHGKVLARLQASGSLSQF